MSVVNISYQGIATSVTFAPASLASAGWRSSALVDNQTNLYLDALFGGSVQTGTVPAGGGTLEFYVGGSWDGVEFTGGAAGGSGTITWGTTSNTNVLSYLDLKLVGVVSVDATDDNKDMKFGPYSVAQAFGTMPLEWVVIMKNATGATLHATGTNNHLEYTGIEYTVV